MSAQTLRIIGGSHRGRKLVFPAAEGLRPTPDRVRETLFNWLQPVITGARCLDMFAGSGVLGMEAISRGAETAVLIEQQSSVASQLVSNVEKLGLQQVVQVIKGDAFQQLADMHDVMFDVVFIDPPFNQDLVVRACAQLARQQLLKPGARIYVESERSLNASELPAGWEISHAKKAGQVFYHLLAAN